MADIFKNIIAEFFSEECFEKYFYEFNYFDVGCFKALLSKGLGYGIIAGSVLVKIPQIIKILNNKSAEGLNLFAILLEIFVITLNLAYSFVKGFPFSAWGDASFLALQTLAIACLVLFHSRSLAESVIFFIAYIGFAYVLMGGITSVEILWSAQAFNIPILVIGKLSQAWSNYSNKSTGQLSAITCFLLFFGSLARIFTSIQETGDFMMILTYCVSTTTNGVIVAQLLYYWNSDKKVKSKGGKKSSSPVKSKTPKSPAKAKSKKTD